jgi:hypothetical protein
MESPIEECVDQTQHSGLPKSVRAMNNRDHFWISKLNRMIENSKQALNREPN